MILAAGLNQYILIVLQVLFMTEDFRSSINQCCSKDPTAFDALLGNMFAELEKGLSKTHSITKKLGITDVYEQRDAAEYYEKILCLSSAEASKIFKGELIHKTTCVACKKRNNSRSRFWILPLPMEDSRDRTYSVERGLKAFFKKEKVFGENKMYCNQCKEKQDAVIESEITQNPEILTLLLKRFTFNYECNCYIKLHCKVYMPETLHMENSKYDLYAVVNHFGDLTGGHYTAEIKSFENGEWYCFNDDVVETVSKPLFSSGNTSVRSQTAYLLMYRKESLSSENPQHQAQCSHLDVEEGRHVAAQRRHCKLDESGRGRDLFGDALKTSNGTSSGKLEEHKDLLLQSDSEEGVDILEPSWVKQRSHFSRMQKDRGHQHLQFNSERVTKHYDFGRFEQSQSQISPKNILKLHDIAWDRTEKHYSARRTETKTKCGTVGSPRAESAESGFVADESIAGTNNSCSPSSVIYPSKPLLSSYSVNTPSDCRLRTKHKNHAEVRQVTTASRRMTLQKREEPVKQKPWKW
ncbi:ubiquitin carboxyl-terminal hydrolase 47-like [Solea senegalensis]|uniref:Ubiquitin carboxyl-terminal hydrolase 47-like n=1 Tax=Solea senegalensis TaxID=28829 RepID=A0AAV6QW32_SOLSE|nr:ubiquitin carboxyl-terminal hydrolase 47-like [Solea senegalensis]